MLFSQREKIVSERAIQLKSIDNGLRNGLWNALDICFWSQREKQTRYSLVASADYFPDQPLKTFVHIIWMHFFKERLDALPWQWRLNCSQIRNKFYELQWNEVYDFLEFCSSNCYMFPVGTHTDFMNYCNGVLQAESSAYRFVDGKICAIINELEIGEIELAASTPYDNINTHIKSAVEKFSDRNNPDPRNCIKESISAVESVSRLITQNQKATLGEALKKVGEKINLHPALEQGFLKIYGYTSDSAGIRHSLMEESKLTTDDAKFMLVSCSAFVNYLLTKANQAGIKLKG